MINKKNILAFSLGSFCFATLLGIYVALSTNPNASSAESATRLTVIATILGTLGVSSFFVGLAYPKE